jgi:hypothetical protein
MSDSDVAAGHQRARALQLGPKKRPYVRPPIQLKLHMPTICRRHTDPLVHHGRHFGRTVHSLCNVSALITNGLLRLGELADEPEESFTYE